MAVLFENNASTTLSATLTNAATGIACTDISTWPSPSSPDFGYATIQEGSTVEIIKFSGRSGNRLTPVTRAQDGTSTPASFSTAARIEMRATQVILESFLQQGATVLTPYAIGDIFYASSTSALSKLAAVATGRVLASGGVGAAPAWSATPTVGSLTASGAGASLTATGTSAEMQIITTAADSQAVLRLQNDARSFLLYTDGATTGDPFTIRDETQSATRYRVTSAGTFIGLAPLGGIGHGTGAGGTVTQQTSKSTGVELNKVTGQITMNNATLNLGVTVSFTLTNSVIAATDLVLVNHCSGGTQGGYGPIVAFPSAGSCVISVKNNTGSNLSEAIVLQFIVLKAVTS